MSGILGLRDEPGQWQCSCVGNYWPGVAWGGGGGRRWGYRRNTGVSVASLEAACNLYHFHVRPTDEQWKWPNVSSAPVAAPVLRCLPLVT